MEEEMKFRARPMRDEKIEWQMKDGSKMERIGCSGVVKLLGEWLLCVKFVLPLHIISDHEPCLGIKNYHY